MSPAILDATTVREAARGRWHSILPALSIIVPNHQRKHAPCPTCGGKDRFRFDDLDGSGSWFCNVCDPHAGDGFALVMKASQLPFREALGAVASVLGLDHTVQTRPRRPLPPPPVRINRRATAFRFQLAALDLRLRASRIQEAATNLDIESLTDQELDHAIELTAKRHADIARAELFEQVMDGIWLREFIERKKFDEFQTRTA